MICRFNIKSWQKGWDNDNSYCFKIPFKSGRNLISFNKKFTKITEHDKYLEVEFMEWYVKPAKFNSEYWEQSHDRIDAIEKLKDEYKLMLNYEK